MLEELRDALRNGKIEFYWDKDYNLLEKIGPEQMRNMQHRLDNVLKSIRKNIRNDAYAIARCVCEYLHFLHASNINTYELIYTYTWSTRKLAIVDVYILKYKN